MTTQLLYLSTYGRIGTDTNWACWMSTGRKNSSMCIKKTHTNIIHVDGMIGANGII